MIDLRGRHTRRWLDAEEGKHHWLRSLLLLVLLFIGFVGAFVVAGVLVVELFIRGVT